MVIHSINFPNRIEEDIVMGEGGIIAEIDAMDFIKVIGGPLPIVLKKNENSHEVCEENLWIA